MKHPFFYSVFFLCLFSNCSKQIEIDYSEKRQEFQAFPKVEDVVVRAYAPFAQEPAGLTMSHKIEKHPDGWYLAYFDLHQDLKFQKRTKIWDAETKKYLIDSNARAPQILKQIQQSYGIQWSLFDQCPACGYEEGAQAIIELMQHTENLNASELECLARAYYKAAILQLRPSQNGQRIFTDYEKTLDPQKIQDQALANFELYVQKGIETYERLEQISPKYKTFIGSISIKRSNEYVAAFYELHILGQKKRSQNFLKENLYDSAVLSFAEDLLTSCPPQSILLSYGDTDTYALLYAQHQLGIRPDILVINSSFLHKNYYLNYLSNLAPKNKKLKLSLPATFYNPQTHSGYWVLGKKKSSIKWKNYLDSLQANPQAYLYKDLPGQSANKQVQLIPGKRIKLSVSNKKLYFRPTSNLLMNGDIVLWDIILSNTLSSNRPFCIANTVSPIILQKVGLSKYLKKIGLVDILSMEEQSFMSLDDTSAYKHFTQSFKHFHFKEKHKGQINYELFAHAYMNLGWKLLHLYKDFEQEINQVKFREVLEKMEKYYPARQAPYGNMHIFMAEYFHKIQETEKRNAHIDQYLQYCQTKKIMNTRQKEEIKLAATKFREMGQIESADRLKALVR